MQEAHELCAAIWLPGAWLVTPQGHLVGAHSVLFHAPDSQVHGVLARQREIEQLQQEAQQRAEALEQGKQQAAQAEETYHAIEGRIAPLRSLQQRYCSSASTACRCRY